MSIKLIDNNNFPLHLCIYEGNLIIPHHISDEVFKLLLINKKYLKTHRVNSRDVALFKLESIHSNEERYFPIFFPGLLYLFRKNIMHATIGDLSLKKHRYYEKVNFFANIIQNNESEFGNILHLKDKLLICRNRNSPVLIESEYFCSFCREIVFMFKLDKKTNHVFKSDILSRDLLNSIPKSKKMKIISNLYYDNSFICIANNYQDFKNKKYLRIDNDKILESIKRNIKCDYLYFNHEVVSITGYVTNDDNWLGFKFDKIEKLIIFRNNLNITFEF